MAKRLIIMLAAMAVVLAGLGFFKFRQVQSAVQASAFQPPPEAVTSLVVHPQEWPAIMTAIGTTPLASGEDTTQDKKKVAVELNS